MGQLFPQLFTDGRPTHHNLAMHPFTLVCPTCRTRSTRACLFLFVFRYGIAMLDEFDFAGDGLRAFKTSVNCTLRVRLT